MDRRLIDGAIVSRKTAAFSREPMIATTRDEIIAAAGSDFGGSSHLEELGDRYTTYSPTVSSVRRLRGKPLDRVAMVGTPCQIKTIRKMQCLGILPAHIISYTIGLFCIENFGFDDKARKELEDRLGFDFTDISKLNIKDDLLISLRDGKSFQVPLDDIDDLARAACLACTEFANDFADIAVGGLGSPDGYTTVLVRTETGARVFEDAVRLGYIEEREFADVAEERSEKTKMMAKVISFARRKQERGERRLEELVSP
jgi:coenzyme F420 hydrogenase subunit beta